MAGSSVLSRPAEEFENDVSTMCKRYLIIHICEKTFLKFILFKEMRLFFYSLFLYQPSLEAMWAMKAMEHAEVYFNVSLYNIAHTHV